ncbi:hypothetical protein F4692_000724 [Nocardioides cavernae]|uniref:Uncharacterized protein n=1 Tax=Nocardioides cavernae TaxID=1921566 RepID=A0A7Y9KQI1_9ACTN|nr:hypothetical protein [Nocardioides cavernae]NYE35620.1 hypothetical protein [Nocardioides cavernae]
MRITVECGGFTRAADACLTANQTSAVLAGSLGARLSGCAGMAGDDATSSDFARAYDPAAGEALAALADLTHAFIGAGRLLDRTGENHARAESAAAGHPVLGYGGGALHEGAYVRVRPTVPPSSLGAQEPSLGAVDRWILDQVEGFVWPSADIGLLHAAASAWRRAAASTTGLTDHLDAAVSLLEHQRSPEVPLAVDALTDLGTIVGDTAWQLGDLAAACEDYADAGAAARDRTRALLAEVAQMTVEGVAFSALVTGLTGGLGGGAATAAALARIRTVAPRFVAILAAVRTAAAAAVVRIERAVEALADLRARVERFLRIPVRDEAGSIGKSLPGARLPGRPKPDVDDPKLSNYVDQLFKGVSQPNRTGDGTTMDAIRHEIASGDLVHGKDHVRKGRDILRGLERWLRTRDDASQTDRETARALADELRSLLHDG